MNKITGYFLWLAIIIFAGARAIKLLSAFNGTMPAEAFTVLITLVGYVALCGFALAAIIYKFVYSRTSNSLNEYKRELEKESIDKTESSSKIKVLESKIEVLENAQNAQVHHNVYGVYGFVCYK